MSQRYASGTVVVILAVVLGGVPAPAQRLAEVAAPTRGFAAVTGPGHEAAWRHNDGGLPSSKQRSVILNGSFEDSELNPEPFLQLFEGNTDIAFWVVKRTSIDYVEEYWEPAAGTRSLDLNGQYPGGIEQTFTTVPGGMYGVHFDMAGNPEGEPEVKTMLVSAGDTSVTFTFDSADHTNWDMGWIRKGFVFTALAKETTLSFISLVPNGVYGPALDNVWVVSFEDCELALEVRPASLRPGEELQIAIDLYHRRPLTVTVPFLLWIEDATAQVVAQESSPPITLKPGDHRQLRMAVTLPADLPAGSYRVLVGVKRMQQGIAWGSQQFEIVE